jgi:cytidine deaminase
MPESHLDPDLELIDVATSLIAARADGRFHTAAAAARAGDGRVLTGVNVLHFTGGPCAELVVLGRAAAEGVDELIQIVAVGDRDRGILSPCGRCRQMLLDVFPNIRVVVRTGSSTQAVPIAELLPWANRRNPGSGSTPVQN